MFGMKFFKIVQLFFMMCVGSCLSTTDKVDQNIKQTIVLKEVNCLEGKSPCECLNQVFKCDSNIYFIKTGSSSPYKFDSLAFCFELKMKIYKSLIPLDSIYYSNIQNKSLLYMGEFLDGTYERKGRLLTLELSFLNMAINSSRTTVHRYEIVYDLETAMVKHLGICFMK